MKKLFTLILLLAFCSGIKAGTPILLSQLIGKWKLIDENYKDCVNTWEFTGDTMKQTWKYKLIDAPSIYSRPYYLFTGIPSKYEPSLVWQTRSGTHIIYYSKRRKKVLSYEIVSLKGDTLTLSQFAPRAIGRNAGIVTITLKRVSR